MQALKPPPSSSHSKAAPASLEKVKLALSEETVPVGPESIVVSGAVVSTVQLYEAALLWLPAASLATTWKVCPPSARPL